MKTAYETQSRQRAIGQAIALFAAGLIAGTCTCTCFGIVLPGLIQPKKHGNETAAIGALKTIAVSESIFREDDKDLNKVLDYGSLAQLSQAELIDQVLGSGTKQGYLFRAAASGSTSELLWFATASPQVPGTTGVRYFCTNQSAVIYYTVTGPFAINTTDCTIPPNALPLGK